jgi:alpha-tubulin suppressor-like RCC1 family protein
MKRITIILVFALISFQNYAQCYTAISTGANHTLALKSNGTLWAWGYNFGGGLGINSTANSLVPVQVGTAVDWKSISAGNLHSLAIKTNGTLWAWGYNDFGQIGDNTTVNRLVPIQIGAATNWKQVSCGDQHSLALKTDGTLYAWGNNDFGRLGTGLSGNLLIPTQVGTATDWEFISAGSGHSIAKKTNSSLWSWGNNTFGQLGLNSTAANISVPTVISTLIPWTTVSAGVLHNLAVKSDGTLWAWGNNSAGEVGDNTTTRRNAPVQVSAATNWSDISAGYGISAARKSNGTIWTWGRNALGQLGNNTLIDKSIPTQLGTATTWTKIAAGFTHMVALSTESTFFNNVSTWGANQYGQLGEGTTVNKQIPTLINSCNVLLSTETFEKNTFSVYPNPVNDFITIKNDSNLQIDSISVFEVSGKKMKNEIQNYEAINVEKLQSGVYFLKIHSEGKTVNYKFIKL